MSSFYYIYLSIAFSLSFVEHTCKFFSELLRINYTHGAPLSLNISGYIFLKHGSYYIITLKISITLTVFTANTDFIQISPFIPIMFFIGKGDTNSCIFHSVFVSL